MNEYPRFEFWRCLGEIVLTFMVVYTVNLFLKFYEIL